MNCVVCADLRLFTTLPQAIVEVHVVGGDSAGLARAQPEQGRVGPRAQPHAVHAHRHFIKTAPDLDSARICLLDTLGPCRWREEQRRQSNGKRPSVVNWSKKLSRYKRRWGVVEHGQLEERGAQPGNVLPYQLRVFSFRPSRALKRSRHYNTKQRPKKPREHRHNVEK